MQNRGFMVGLPHFMHLSAHFMQPRLDTRASICYLSISNQN
jgi:hypothetical protein